MGRSIQRGRSLRGYEALNMIRKGQVQRGRSLRGYEALNMIRKGQVQGVAKGDILGQIEYARSNFWNCGIKSGEAMSIVCPQGIFATQPYKLVG